MTDTELDAIVVGSGPNGLAAAVTLARAGLSVRVYERVGKPGGGAGTAELTLPGFHHDVCSAVHPMALASEFFREFALDRRIEFAVPEISFAHPLDAGRAALAYRDLDRTREGLGPDGAAYARLMGPLAAHAAELAELTGGSVLRWPRHPLFAAGFARRALEQGTHAWNLRFGGDAAPALITGVAAHTILSQPALGPAAAGLALGAFAHARGWPIPLGGSGAIVAAMVADLRAHGGEIVTDTDVRSLENLPSSRVRLLDVTPASFLRLIGGTSLPAGYRSALERFRYGAGVAKVDFALSDPVPWTNPELRRAGTVHVGGTRAQIAAAENAVAHGRHPEQPFVLASQPSLFDPSRAPAGHHVLWAYTHVPSGSDVDMQEVVIAQIERFAPGFRDTVLAIHSRSALDIARHNPNYPGGDISAGAPSLLQLVRRPVMSSDPWRTPVPGLYLCSASTAPGPGVHGMCGWNAARSALRHDFGITQPPSLAPR